MDTLNLAAVLKKDFSTSRRKTLAKEGKALPDGSFPIENTSDLANAVQAFGRASNPEEAKKHIIARARELNALGSLPDSWNVAKQELAAVLKGDLPGHPFRGNQYTKGGGKDKTQYQRGWGDQYTAVRPDSGKVSLSGGGGKYKEYTASVGGSKVGSAYSSLNQDGTYRAVHDKYGTVARDVSLPEAQAAIQKAHDTYTKSLSIPRIDPIALNKATKHIDRLTDINDHGGALKAMASFVGRQDLAAQFAQIRKEHFKAGGLTEDLMNRRNAAEEQLMQHARSTLHPDDFRKLNGAR